MSLNWKEINIILNELSLDGCYIQKIYQSDYRNIYFQLSTARKNTFLRICLEQGHARLHLTRSRPPSRGKQPRFSEFLRARIKGGRIESASQIGYERIICLSIRRASEITVLYLKLWGNAANIIACDNANTILEVAYRRPARGEIAAETYTLPESSKESMEKLSHFQARPSRAELSYNQSIADEYQEKEDAERKNHLLKDLRRYYSMKEASVSGKISRIEKAERNVDSADHLQNCADIILSQAWKIERGEQSITTQNFRRPGQTLTIPLDPGLSAAENAEKYYSKAKKLRARSKRLGEEMDNTQSDYEALGTMLHTLDNGPSLEMLEELHAAMLEESKSMRGHSITEGRPGLNYSSKGFQILVGRTAKENDLLLRRYTRGNDTWLHTRDYPGAYVFIKQRPGKTIPLDVLLDAGNLSLHFSKARNNGQADLYYTQVKHLRRPKKGKTGLVLPTQEKNLFIQADEGRLNRLLKNSGSE